MMASRTELLARLLADSSAEMIYRHSDIHPIYVKQSNQIQALRFALLMLHKWGGMFGEYDGIVVMTVSRWTKNGMKGPVPFPNCPFFRQWADNQGWADVDGYVGMKKEAGE